MTIVFVLDIDGQLGQRTLKAISVDREAEFQLSRVHASLHLPLRSDSPAKGSESLSELRVQSRSLSTSLASTGTPKARSYPRRIVASDSVEISGSDYLLFVYPHFALPDFVPTTES